MRAEAFEKKGALVNMGDLKAQFERILSSHDHAASPSKPVVPSAQEDGPAPPTAVAERGAMSMRFRIAVMVVSIIGLLFCGFMMSKPGMDSRGRLDAEDDEFEVDVDHPRRRSARAESRQRGDHDTRASSVRMDPFFQMFAARGPV